MQYKIYKDSIIQKSEVSDHLAFCYKNGENNGFNPRMRAGFARMFWHRPASGAPDRPRTEDWARRRSRALYRSYRTQP